MGEWLGGERNQVLFSRATGTYYFVPLAQRAHRVLTVARQIEKDAGINAADHAE